MNNSAIHTGVSHAKTNRISNVKAEINCNQYILCVESKVHEKSSFYYNTFALPSEICGMVK